MAVACRACSIEPPQHSAHASSASRATRRICRTVASRCWHAATPTVSTSSSSGCGPGHPLRRSRRWKCPTSRWIRYPRRSFRADDRTVRTMRPVHGNVDYDVHGVGYAEVRRADPRIAAQLHAALGRGRTVLNVGAGTGSYEPADRYVLAIEPSAAMRAQRPPHLAPAAEDFSQRSRQSGRLSPGPGRA